MDKDGNLLDGEQSIENAWEMHTQSFRESGVAQPQFNALRTGSSVSFNSFLAPRRFTVIFEELQQE